MLGSRPGQLIYLMFLALICGKNAFGYHLASILLHSTNVALLFILIRRLIVKDRAIVGIDGNSLSVFAASACATIIFAIHPITVESAELTCEVSGESRRRLFDRGEMVDVAESALHQQTVFVHTLGSPADCVAQLLQVDPGVRLIAHRLRKSNQEVEVPRSPHLPLPTSDKQQDGGS
jgi:hypothetical protein